MVMMIKLQIANVPLNPRLFKIICSVALEEARARCRMKRTYRSHGLADGVTKNGFHIRAHIECNGDDKGYRWQSQIVSSYGEIIYAPHPNTQPKAVDRIIARGTATFAFLTSSLICTLESVPPMTHAGARKESKNANPFGQRDTENKYSIKKREWI